MKHTIDGRHGHMYRQAEGKKPSLFELEKFCVSAKEASESDIMVERLEGNWRISLRYHTCWTCHNPTERPGGYKGSDRKKILFYECDKCSPWPEKKKNLKKK